MHRFFPLILFAGWFALVSVTIPQAAAQVPPAAGRSGFPEQTDGDARQDGSGAVIPLPFFPHSVQFDLSGKRALVIRAADGKTQLICYDLDTLAALGSLDYSGTIEAIAIADDCFLLIDAGQRRVMVVDQTLKSRGDRKFNEPVGGVPPLFEGTLQIGANQYSLPDLEGPLAAAGKPAATPVPTEAGWIVEGFVMDAARRKPLWFAGHPAIPGTQTPFRYSGRAPAVTGRRLAPMTVRGTEPPPTGRPWEWQLATPITWPYRDSNEPRGSPPAPEWARLQAVARSARSGNPAETDTLLGRIRVPLPPDAEIQKVTNVFLTATRERCLALVGQLLLVFRINPERAAEWGDVPRIALAGAPLVIPPDSVTAWDLKALGNRKIERVAIRQGPLTWDEGERRLLIDPRPVLEALDERSLLATLFGSRHISPRASFDRAAGNLQGSDSAVMRILKSAAGRPLRGIVWSLPVEVIATCSDGSVLELAGNLITEIDRPQLRSAFDARQAERLVSLRPPPLNPDRQLNITYPRLQEASAESASDSEPVPQIPNRKTLLLQGLLEVFGVTLVTGLFLRLSCSIFNEVFGQKDPIQVPSVLKSFSLAFVLSLPAAGADFLSIAASNSLVDLNQWQPMLTRIGLGVLAFGARLCLLVAGITVLGRLSFGQSVVVTFMLAVMSTTVFALLGVIVAVTTGFH